MGPKVLGKLAEKWDKMMPNRSSTKPLATWVTLRNIAFMSSGDCTREAYIRWCERHNRGLAALRFPDGGGITVLCHGSEITSVGAVGFGVVPPYAPYVPPSSDCLVR